MGCNTSSICQLHRANEPKNTTSNNITADEWNCREKERQIMRRKCLLLGTGACGKSTIFKQIVQLYSQRYSEKDLKSFTCNIYGNVMSSIKGLIEASEELGQTTFNGRVYDCSLRCRNSCEAIGFLDRCTLDYPLTPGATAHIKHIWNDHGIQNTLKLRSTFQFPYDAEYFMGRLDEISRLDYIPSFEDLLHCRNRTTGILEGCVNVDDEPDHTLCVVDVGGFRNERRKWIHCFDGVDSVIYVVPMSEYDQMLFEDDRVNRMQESLDLFEEICLSRWFKRVPIFIIFNKVDLFKKKIMSSPFSQCPAFNCYTGPDPPQENFEEAKQYVEAQFRSRITDDMPLEVYYTNALDPEDIRYAVTGVCDAMEITCNSCPYCSGADIIWAVWEFVGLPETSHSQIAQTILSFLPNSRCCMQGSD